MRVHHRWAILPSVCALIIVLSAVAQAQLKYASGQNVQPAFDGWIRNADGSATMYFGYLNRNYEEEVNVPIGPNSSFTVPASDSSLGSTTDCVVVACSVGDTASFEPSEEFVVTSGKEATTKVRFSVPGTYILRGFANDGQFRSREPVDVTVNVTGTVPPKR
jgi:hypothetical protein